MNPYVIGIGITVGAAFAWMIYDWATAPLVDAEDTLETALPDCCDLVDVTEIEPPHTPGISASVLKRQYVAAEAELVAAHDAAMAGPIQRSMAESLIQGWPLDIAVSQATYSPKTGICGCRTCRHFLSEL